MNQLKRNIFITRYPIGLLVVCSVIIAAHGATIGAATQTSANQVVDVWPDGKMPGKGADKPEADTPSRGDGVRRITNISRPQLTIFPARHDGKRTPAMIVCPGGGYNYVAYNKEGTDVASWLNSAGITALVLKYRAPQNRDGALQDLQRAVSLARRNAARWNIDPKHLGIIGFSAGGHLAAKASTVFNERTYPAIYEVDKVSCRPDFVVLVYPGYLEKDGQVAPDLNLKARIPPTLIVHTEDDKALVPGSKLYHLALNAAKVPNEFLLYATGGHGYGLHANGDARVWPDATLKWLKDFTIVQWDQRGAGKTYAKNPDAPPEPERVVLDGIELARYLCHYLAKKKILLLGHSWGSHLAVEMVQRLPELFAAYIGTRQVGSWHASVQTQFDFMLARSRAANDRKKVALMEAIGTPDPTNATQYFLVEDTQPIYGASRRKMV